MKIPEYEDTLGKVLNPLEQFVINWEPSLNVIRLDFREDLQKLVDWLLTQSQSDERED